MKDLSCDEDVCVTSDSESNGEECNMSEKLLSMADEAWLEVIKDKMKDEIEKSCGDKLSKVAAFVTKANGEKWKSIMASKSKCEEFKAKVEELLSSSDK